MFCGIWLYLHYLHFNPVRHFLITVLFLGLCVWRAIGGERLLIVTTERLLAPAEELAEIHRQSLRMPTDVLVLSDSLPSDSVRLSIKAVCDTARTMPRYLIIYGTAWTDRDGDAFFGMIESGLKPSKVAYTSPGIAVGRIPAGDADVARAFNQKILRYMNSAEHSADGFDIALLADDSDGLEHQADAEKFAGIINTDDRYRIHKLYVGEFPIVNGKASGANGKLQSLLADGAGLLVYVGHGNETSITGEGLLDAASAYDLDNSVLPWGFFSSCRIGSFGLPTRSFSESLLFNPSGGVIGCVTSPQAVRTSFNELILTEFSQQWADADDSLTFGDIWLRTQQVCMETAATQINRALGLNTLSFNLLGDPAIPRLIPVPIAGFSYNPDDGTIAGHADGCTDGSIVEIDFYGNAVVRNGVSHNDLPIGRIKLPSNGGAFSGAVKLPAEYSGSAVCAVAKISDTVSHRGFRSRADFLYRQNDGDGLSEPLIISNPRIDDGMIAVDIASGNIRQDFTSLTGYPRCIIDGRTPITMQIREDTTGCRLVAPLPKIPPREIHHARILATGINGETAIAELRFAVSLLRREIGLTCRNIIARSEITFQWDMLPIDMPMLLKITDSNGAIIHSAVIQDHDFYDWDLVGPDGHKVPNGLYRCCVTSVTPGHAWSPMLDFAVLPE